ncbi:tyrosine protein phosphatase [Bifidobacterium dentium]|uniref:arsenate reductase/protein-tyrosine-phosphatase family protein n=1 Tax=Bifidobacterium dentium TaxID=1689 RepID=UPI003D168AE5
MRVLFVCTGNICRSPMGELLFRMYTAGTSIEVDSAGTHSLVGHEIDGSSAALLTSAGIDSSAFRSKQLTRQIAQECDLILCFEEEQLQNIVGIAPAAVHYTFTLPDFSNMCAYCAQQNMIEGFTLPERLQSVIAQATTIRPMLPQAATIADPYRKDFSAFRRAVDATDTAIRNIMKSLSFGTSASAMDMLPLTASLADASNPPYYRGDVVAGDWSWPIMPFDNAIVPVGVAEKSDGTETIADSLKTTMIRPDGNDTIALPTEVPSEAGHASNTDAMPQITEDTSIRDVAITAESRSRKRRIILIASAAVVLTLAATGGTVFWHHTQTVARQNAFSSCKKSASRYAKVKKQYDSAIQSANLLTTIPTSELADASTVDMLKSELSSTYDFIPTTQCVVSLSTANLTQAAEQNNKNASAMEKSLKSLTKASDAVTKAHDAQTTSIVSAARQSLQTTIEQATKLLESSKGNVADEQTRTDLQKTVDDANALLQNDDATIEQLTEAREAMGKAMQAVTDSVAQYNADNQVYEKPRQTTNSSNSGQQTYYNPSEYKTDTSTETPDTNDNNDTNSSSGNKLTPTSKPTTSPTVQPNPSTDPTQNPEPTPEPTTDHTEKPNPSPTASPDSGSDTPSQPSMDAEK